MQGKRGQKPAETPVSKANEQDPRWVTLGRVSGLFGVRGWLKIYSHTSPRENILDYPDWYLSGESGSKPFKLEQGKVHGKGIIAKLDGCDDRDQAASLVGMDIRVKRDELPQAGPGEYYWTDLEGLQVITCESQALGKVDYLFETGSNDVMVLKGDRRRLVPFIDSVIKEVDLEYGVITVDWDPDF
jgi:16S rRNA processing protein RimM